MDWFRMYGEFANDPKVQSMPEAMQRRLVMLLCLRSSNTLVTLQEDEVAFALRISDADLAETKAVFVRKGFINEAWEIQNWDKRQFVSDSSASRVAKHRAKVKEEAETPVVTASNVTVTPQIQNRTDTEVKPLPGKPDAIAILDYLNAKSNRNYRPVKANLTLITARLSEATVDECRAVIDAKVQEWQHDPKMSGFLRPETLFGATKFAGYLGQLGSTAKPVVRDWE